MGFPSLCWFGHSRNGIAHINEVILRRARLMLPGQVPVCRYTPSSSVSSSKNCASCHAGPARRLGMSPRTIRPFTVEEHRPTEFDAQVCTEWEVGHFFETRSNPQQLLPDPSQPVVDTRQFKKNYLIAGSC